MEFEEEINGYYYIYGRGKNKTCHFIAYIRYKESYIIIQIRCEKN